MCVALLAPRGAFAEAPAHNDESPACTMTMRDEAKLSSEWIAAIHDAERHLAAHDDCAHVALVIVADAEGVRIVATTPGGRRAERTVTKPSSLRAIAIGLVASIPNEPFVAKSAEEPSPGESPASMSRASPPPITDAHAPNAPRLVGALTAGGRLGMPTRVFAIDFAVRGDVLVDDWFLTTGVRYAPLGFLLQSATFSGYSYSEVALELGAGRRFRVGPAIVDVAVAPAIVIMHESADLPLDLAAGTRNELRGDLLLRALFGSAKFKSALTLDFEIAPFALGAPLVADEAIPTLPNWTLGLGFGVAGDLL